MSRDPLPSVEILDPRRYADEGYPHADWARLRRESPVHWCERAEGEPFWALTRHEDIVHVSQRPGQYLNAPRLVMSFDPKATPEDFGLRMLLNMDPPEHRAYRNLISQRFTPRALGKIRSRVDGIADEILDRVMEHGAQGETDFVATVSALLPIWVIAEMLGVPRSDWELLFDWTNKTIGAADPEYRDEGASPKETIEAARLSLFHYFDDMTKDRRKHPQDDLVSLLANAEVDGKELPPFELLSYYLLLVIAGNETTRNATSGGLLALIENRDEWAKVRNDPALLKPLVEEVLRWTSPVIHFCRTAAEDVELAGKRIRAGDRLVLFYPSANRDEAVFDEHDRFRADRRRNRHLAFGIGEHFCLGAHVARLELEVILRHLVARLEDVEIAGPVERLRSSVVGGIKHLPIRYRLRKAA
ncbi:MAG: cytochrome P450 [Myxococcales bacterium]|nr:cytochrome P450 [Myxococcales bacterium]